MCTKDEKKALLFAAMWVVQRMECPGYKNRKDERNTMTAVTPPDAKPVVVTPSSSSGAARRRRTSGSVAIRRQERLQTVRKNMSRKFAHERITKGRKEKSRSCCDICTLLMLCVVAIVISINTLHIFQFQQKEQDGLLRLKSPPKPRLILHVGPHKTASTTLQTHLTRFRQILKRDNYLYTGRYYHPYYNSHHRLILNRTPDGPLQEAARGLFLREDNSTLAQMLRDTYFPPPFLFRRHGIKLFHRQPPNVILSDESLLKMLNMYYEKNPTGNPWEALTQDWDVTVVVAYRRFYDWLPSAKFQRDRPMQEPWRAEWPGQGGVALKSLFSDNHGAAEILDEWQYLHFFSETVLENFRSLQKKHVKLKVIHLYGKFTTRTNFFCHVLQDAPKSCYAARRQDAMEAVARGGGGMAEHHWNARSDKVDKDSTGIKKYPIQFYDAVATAAASKGWIDTAVWKRQQVAQILKNHHEAVLDLHSKTLQKQQQQQQQEEGTGVESSAAALALEAVVEALELPLTCPTEQQLDDLLKVSLQMERKNVRKLYYARAGGAASHRAAFRRATTAKSRQFHWDYCWVDTDKLFADDDMDKLRTSWKTFILQHFFPKQVA
jgi:hypothetical protein